MKVNKRICRQANYRRYWDLVPSTQTGENTASVTVFVYWRTIQADCVILSAVEVSHGVIVLGVEDTEHGDGLVRPVAGYRVDCSLSDSGLPVGSAAAGSMADLQQTAGATWNQLAAVH